MAQLALYRKYRSNDFDELYGQDFITRTLKNSVEKGNFSHAYLFCGPRGTGKTSAARILAKAINCDHPTKGNPDNKCQSCKTINDGKTMDIIEIDAASHTQVDNIREVIVERAHFAPTNLKYKVYIIDEAHMLSKSSFNALLKTLEEPPAHSIFILATTEPNKIIPTIISRCQRFDFKRISPESIVNRLEFIAKEEKIDIDKAALEIIAKSSEGGFRDAISLLDQISSTVSDKITKETIEQVIGLTDLTKVEDFAFSLVKKEPEKAFAVAASIIENGSDVNQFIKSLIEYFRLLLVAKLAGIKEAGFISSQEKTVEEIISKTDGTDLIRLIDIVIETQNKYKYSGIPQLILEIIAAKAITGYITETPVTAKETKPEKANTSSKVENTEHTQTAPIKAKTGGNALKWQELLLETKTRNNSIHAFLRVCDPEFKEDTVVLHFPYKFHKERIEDIKNRRVVEEAFAKVYGVNYKVKCVLKPLTAAAAVPTKKKDDLLEEALEIFGGEVIE